MGEIPERIRKFFESKIDSVELLHVLILLYDYPDRDWTFRSISDELRSSESSVTKRIRTLIERRVLRADAERAGVVRYVPPDPETASLAGEAVAYYRRMPYRVVEFVFTRRGDPVRSIADAFRFRKDEEE